MTLYPFNVTDIIFIIMYMQDIDVLHKCQNTVKSHASVLTGYILYS